MAHQAKSHARRYIGLLAAAGVAATFLVGIPSAFASAGLAVAPSFPANVSVGQTGLPASLSITNESTSPDDTSNITLSTIALVPACGSTTSVGNGNCPAASADPGVFLVSAGTGDAASACAGITFTVKVTDTSTGRVAFTPSTSVVLTQNATCTIDYTINVLKLPTHSLGTPPPNTATTEQFAYSAGTNGLGHAAASVGSSSTVVAKAAPTIVTTASAAVTIGGAVTDAARLGNGFSPTGTITYSLYGPGDAMCLNTPAFTVNQNVGRGNATYTSPAFTPTLPGAYSWVATYNGDGNNAAFTEACGSTNESVTVNQFVPSLSTQASAGVTIGGAISDAATLTGGGLTPTGTITFDAYGPNDPNCNGTIANESTVSVTAGNGTYGSTPFTPAAVGTYTWTATYSGDTNNAGTSEGCGGTNESNSVGKATPSITTQASLTGADAISDSATLTGGLNPGGTVTFQAFGPDDASCSATPAFTANVPVGAGGQESSGTFAPTQPGTYVWVATYNGDANNNTKSEPCGGTDETVSVPIVISTSTLPDAPVGQAYKQTLGVAGGKKAYHWSVIAGTLPDGLKLSSAGVLSGTPTTPGTSDFTVQVTDSSKPALTVSRDLSLTVTPMTVATTSLPDATLGVAYKGKLVTSGGKSAFHWTILSGALPAGVKLSSAGALSGTPTAPGTANFVVQVSDSSKPTPNTATQALSITVDPMTITTTSLPAGQVGKAYSAKLAVNGGVGAHKWSVISGTLPPGVKLSAAGALSGKPTSAGSYPITVQVADSAKPTPNTATQNLTISVS
jgi:hypothetical protein